MNAREYMKRLAYLEECIRMGRIRGVASIKQKFGCCGKTACTLVAELREMGVNVRYSKALGKYYIAE